MYLITIILIIVITLCLLLLGLILFNVKMNIYDLFIRPKTPITFSTEFDESLLDGGLRFPIPIINYHRTCFIDSVLNSIANSDTLTKHFKNILPESKVSDERIVNAFTNGLKVKKIISSLIESNYVAKNNKRKLYEILCSLFIRGIDGYNKYISQGIRLYMLYLEKMSLFNQDFESTKTMYAGRSFYEYVCNADYNFILYFNFCEELRKRGKTNIKYTGVLNNCIIVNFGLKHFKAPCDKDSIQSILNSMTETDVFIELNNDISKYDNNIITTMISTCITKYKGKYRCTDIIFDMYEQDNGDDPYHSVYYNIDKKALHDDASVINEIEIDSFTKTTEDNDYYVPCVLHFQMLNDY